MKRWFYNLETRQTAYMNEQGHVVDAETYATVSDFPSDDWREYTDDPRDYGFLTLQEVGYVIFAHTRGLD
jgi:hypothetical protein